MLAKEKMPRFSVFGDKGTFIKYGLDPQEDRLKANFQYVPNIGEDTEEDYGLLNVETNGQDKRKKLKTTPGDYMQFYDNLYRAIEHREKLLVPPEDAKAVLKLIDLAYQSNREMRRIIVDEWT